MAKNSRTSKVVFLLSLLVAVFWVLANLVDVYQSAVGGAIFELLWFTAVGLVFVLPIFSLVYLVKEKFNPKSLYLFSLLINMVTLLYIFFGTNR